MTHTDLNVLVVVVSAALRARDPNRCGPTRPNPNRGPQVSHSSVRSERMNSTTTLGEHQHAQEPSQRAPWPRLGTTHTPHAAQLVRMCVRLMQSDPRVTPSSALYSPLRRNFPRADPNPSNGLPVSPFSRLWLTGLTAAERRHREAVRWIWISSGKVAS